VPVVHEVVGFAVVAIFAVGWIWGLIAHLRKREPGERFWVWLSVAQVGIGIEALLGIVLFVAGYRPDTKLHYIYGVGPIVLLVIAHSTARDENFRERPWVVFAWAAFFCWGLTLRALMTGLGMP
jgi:hypothetical protein